MLIQENLTIDEKLKILTDAAKYDVACTSSGVERRGKKGHLGNSSKRQVSATALRQTEDVFHY